MNNKIQGLLFYYILNKYLPTIANILTGSR